MTPMPARTRRSDEAESSPSTESSTATVPRSGRTVPFNSPSSVVFPAPLGPTSATASPGAMSRSTESRAQQPPYSTLTPRTRNWIPTFISSLPEHSELRGHLANAFVVFVARGDQLFARQRGEKLRIVDGEQRLLQPRGEAGAEGLLQVGVRRPVVVGVCRRLPDDPADVGIRLSLLDLPLVDLVVENSHRVLPRFDQLGGLVVTSGESRRRPEQLARRLAGGLADEVFGHQSSRGRALGAKGGFVLAQVSGKAVRQRQSGALVGDEIRVVRGIAVALGDGVRAWHAVARLNAGQAAEPGQKNVAVLERLDGSLIVAHRYVLDRNSELSGEMVGQRAKLRLQVGRVLVRNRGVAEH